MITVWGKLWKNGKTIKSDTTTSNKVDMSAAILECIEYFAQKFDIEAPMWHSQHTKQLGLFRKATFRPDDFIDRVDFDRFELQLLDDEKK
ncbi:hypothetical protein LJC56_06665 [Christensenellaceae bacterium OttesenSCG-928-K19]|nr:hypothetical protein [Christensenellaceae bacterium OttesenSCG-928-K19]